MTPEHLPVEISQRRVNGLELEVAEAGPSDGPLVLLLHGFPDLWQGWHFQLPPLVAAGFRVLAPNQRGYGRSSKPRGVSAYDLDVLAQDVLALVDSDRRAAFQLVGHDSSLDSARSTRAGKPRAPGVFLAANLRQPRHLGAPRLG